MCCLAAISGAAISLAGSKIDPEVVRTFDDIGISGLANIVAAIKIAKHLDLGTEDVIMTVATDSASLYVSERQSFLARRYHDGFDEVNAGEIFGRHLQGIADDHVLELTHFDRKRIFNLGYFTWVEQQGSVARRFRATQGPGGSGARCWMLDPGMGPADRGVQRGESAPRPRPLKHDDARRARG